MLIHVDGSQHAFGSCDFWWCRGDIFLWDVSLLRERACVKTVIGQAAFRHFWHQACFTFC